MAVGRRVAGGISAIPQTLVVTSGNGTVANPFTFASTKVVDYESYKSAQQKELVDLGLLTTREIKNQDPAKPAYRKYFMHGCGHPLGLDVLRAAFSQRDNGSLVDAVAQHLISASVDLPLAKSPVDWVVSTLRALDLRVGWLDAQRQSAGDQQTAPAQLGSEGPRIVQPLCAGMTRAHARRRHAHSSRGAHAFVPTSLVAVPVRTPHGRPCGRRGKIRPAHRVPLPETPLKSESHLSSVLWKRLPGTRECPAFVSRLGSGAGFGPGVRPGAS